MEKRRAEVQRGKKLRENLKNRNGRHQIRTNGWPTLQKATDNRKNREMY